MLIEGAYPLSMAAKGANSLLQSFQSNVSSMKNLSHLNAFITETTKIAESQVKEAQKRNEDGVSLGPLDGRTFAVKDNLCTANALTTCASRFLSSFTPPYTATAVQRLLSSGAAMIGKTNMDEFAMGSSNLLSYYGAVEHPNSPSLSSPSSTLKLVSGGSSGGSAVAVATGMCDFALGSDTGGSVRLPASFCGTVGLKPTYGRVSRHGLIPLANSLDTVGIFAPTVSTAANVLDVISGWDQCDSTSVRREYCSVNNEFTGDEEMATIRVGIPKECDIKELSTESRTMWRLVADELESLGLIVKDVSLPHFSYSVPCYTVICAAEASSNMAKYTGAIFGYDCSKAHSSSSVNEMFAYNRQFGLGPVVKHRIIAGTYFLSYHGRHHYEQALKARNLIKNDYRTVFDKDGRDPVDILITPVSLGPPPTRHTMEELGPVEAYVLNTFLAPVNLAGLPAISVPIIRGGGELPLSVQVISKWFDEGLMIKIAKLIESLMRNKN